MTTADVIEILKMYEQVLYLPKGARKNPLTRGVIRVNYEKIAKEVVEKHRKEL